MLYLLLVLSIYSPILSKSSDTFPDAWYLEQTPPHLELALSYEGVQRGASEKDDKIIAEFLNSVGLNKGNPYCAAFVSYVLEKSNIEKPKIRSGLARHFLTKDSIMATNVRRTNKKIPAGYLVGWQRGNTIFGHLGIVQEWQGNSGRTIEGNTSPPNIQDASAQFSGGGVYQKQRSILPGRHFRIVWFTPYEN